MQIRHLSAGQGLRWIRDGWRLFRRQPFALAALSAFYLLLVLFPMAVPLPLLGPALAGVIAPFASFGMMEACRDADRGQTPTPLAFGVALRGDPPRSEMVRLGVIHAAILLVLGTVLWLGGLDVAVQSTAADGSVAPMFPEGPLLLLRFVILLPVEMAMWFAPVFVGWHRIPAGKAMFFSFFACWRNRWALLTYAIAMLALSATFGGLLLSAVQALAMSQELTSIASAPVALVAAGFWLTTLYPIYRSIVAGPGEAA